MAHKQPLQVVLCWHMHQPDYRDHIRGEFHLPWVYLHGIKDYVDMAVHLQSVPEAKAVINFSPILLEQLELYEQQITGNLNNCDPIRDPLLAALDAPVFPSDLEHRLALVKACLRSNRKNIIERYPAYRRLADIAGLVEHDLSSSSYVSNQYLADLVTWYHLAWLGETIRRSDKRVKSLIEQGTGFTLHQRHELLKIIAELLSSLHERYAKLAGTGQVELSMSPYAHPMLPLLLQFEAAREALPDIHLPILSNYPGGMERTRAQLQQGRTVFENYFGITANGCWPSEGGISSATLKLLAGAGFKWAATGETVIRNSMNDSAGKGSAENSIYNVFCEQGSELKLFARDDTLSDLIGFTYADWHADDAVADLVHRLEKIAATPAAQDGGVVSIIMDGENAWEYYPENGYYFLSALYQKLADHPHLQLTTFQEAGKNTPVRVINKVVAGSWVYGTFSTWIGDENKNRAWDILGDVKRVYDDIYVPDKQYPDKLERVDKQLAVCEGSDWFWWFGDYNPAEAVSDFEGLFRTHISNLYHMLGQEPPQYLSQTLVHGSGTPQLGGVIRPSRESGK